MVAFEDRNIVLTGFMGTGKSTVGRRLAEALGFGWVDSDRLIAERHGPIPDIFDRSGEQVFRAIERNIASELSALTRHVFSTGGRMLLDPANISSLSGSGRIFCLTADTDVLIDRLLSSPTPRPLLAVPDPAGRIRSLLDERRPGYARFAAIPTGLQPAETVIEELLGILSRPTETPTGRRGLAVLGDAATDLPRPVVVLTDDTVGDLHGPCLGPVDRVVTDGPVPEDAASLIVLGGTSVTARLTDRGPRPTVVAPTTAAAMAADHPDGVRVVADLATLQTLPRPGESRP